MRRDVLELRQFYASDLGRAARAMVERKLREAWGDTTGQDVLAVGYATPFVGPLTPLARRVVADALATGRLPGVRMIQQHGKNRFRALYDTHRALRGERSPM